MIVVLTPTQLVRLCEVLEQTDNHWIVDEWLIGVYQAELPFIGWSLCLELLLEATIGPAGGNRKGVLRSVLRARRRIAEALALRVAHPALSGLGLPGQHYEVIPAWGFGEPTPTVFSPRPIEGGEFFALVPEERDGFTWWKPEPVQGGRRLLDPEAHWRFVREGRPAGRA